MQKLREYDVADHGAPSLSDLKKGDIVFVRSFGYDASVMEVDAKHNRLRVRSGSVEIEIPAADIGFRRGKSAETKGGTVTLGAGR